MSDSELEDVPVVNWFDSQSDFPEMSSVNTTPHLSVNVGQTPVNMPHTCAVGDEDSDAADSVPNTGTLAGNALLEGTGPHTIFLLDTLTHTPL